MEYPANWNKSELNLNPYEVAFFYPPDLLNSEGLFKPNIPPVSFVIEVAPKGSTNINASALRFISSFEGDNQSRLVNHNYTMLTDMPAYEGIYYDYRNNETRKALNIWTYSGNDSFGLLYHTEPGYFNQYLPDAKRMIDSFEITNDSNNSSHTG